MENHILTHGIKPNKFEEEHNMDEEKIKELLELMQKQLIESRIANSRLRTVIGLLSAFIVLIIILFYFFLCVSPW